MAGRIGWAWMAVSFHVSHAGEQVITGGSDLRAIIWSTSTGMRLQTFAGFNIRVASVFARGTKAIANSFGFIPRIQGA